MTRATTSQPQAGQPHADTLTRLGAWLFRYRTSIPLPLAAAVVLAPDALTVQSRAVSIAGVGIVAAGEAVRLWAVRHIGAISRTRSDRLGPLVSSGPFALVRNPLYIGNVMLWAGFAMSARLPWLALVFIALLMLEYHAIVRWEEQLLVERLGERYRRYTTQVSRWVPSLSAMKRPRDPEPDQQSTGRAPFTWRDTFHSERGTLIAIAAGYIVLWVKAGLTLDF